MSDTDYLNHIRTLEADLACMRAERDAMHDAYVRALREREEFRETVRLALAAVDTLTAAVRLETLREVRDHLCFVLPDMGGFNALDDALEMLITVAEQAGKGEPK